jgi:hypothetical protein
MSAFEGKADMTSHQRDKGGRGQPRQRTASAPFSLAQKSRIESPIASRGN